MSAPKKSTRKTTAATEQTSDVGRPKGAATRNDPVVTDRPPSCPACHSTNREKLHHIRTHFHSSAGYYHRTTWRRVKCRDCGQIYCLNRTESQREPFSVE